MKSTPDLRTKEDKLGSYLANAAKNYLFDELSPAYLERSGLDFLKGISVPLRAEDMVDAQNGKGLDVSRLADNMAVVIGANTHFPYVNEYIKFLAACFNEKLVGVLTSKGSENLSLERYRMAVIYFRAALLLDGADLKAVFGYASVCRQWYLSLEGDDEEELTAILKQESTNYYEWCTQLHPEFASAYYFLGYAYLNLGLYTKASLIWKQFIKLSPEENEETKEVQERLDSLVDPVKIEGGINSLLAGRYEEGLKILEPYVKTEYNDWWPLHYYLAGAYRELGCTEEAVEGYTRVLRLSPSNVESVCALAELYAELGDNEMADKYYNKARLLRSQEGQ